MQCLALVLSSLTKALSLTVASKKSHNGLHIAESTKFIRKNNGGKKTKQREAEPKIIQLGLIKIDFHKLHCIEKVQHDLKVISFAKTK